MQQNNRPKIIGITGSIGSGKSTFCRILAEKYPVYSADEIAHAQLSKTEVKDTLIARWGKAVLVNDELDRGKIAAIVFSDKRELDFLNCLIHPLVLVEMQEIINQALSPVLFFEVPLLFEANLQACFDYIVSVITDPEITIRRLQLHNTFQEKDVRNRLQAQLENHEKIKASDTIIENNGSLTDLRNKATEFLAKIEEIPYRSVKPFYPITKN
ncbi:MAG TPA: dephospho-CoA kinase [Candidatus Cloacimonadota bacterium]|nr:dephospho-CoA kinase [Candidatus Cloacimonadota bacterium]HOV15925.1 dephospho-CoA kinase [Candidatus Cloacimonadota bacterium]HQL14280.1 dephospho-CoA kinase [Candidatus Cloacimonadota bacterium]